MMENITFPRSLPSGEIIAAEVSEDEYMEKYAEHFYEWVEGIVIKMSPVSFKHDQLLAFLRHLLEIFLTLRPIGKIAGEPFVMRLEAVPSRREPDLQIILNENSGTLRATYMDGPADIVIEIVSPGSVAVDYGDKFTEYEKGGVGEYWIIDPIRRASHFYRLTDGIFMHYIADIEGNYATPKLPGLVLHVPILWQDDLPDILQTVQMVRDMLAE